MKSRVRQAGIEAFNHSSYSALIQRLKKALTARALAQGSRRLVLIIDEAHLTTEKQFGFISDIFNELSEHFRVFTLLVGRMDLTTLPTKYRSAEFQNSFLRFFHYRHQIHGIKLDDLELALESLEYSSGSSVIEKHFPTLSVAGWTLAQAAQPIRDEMEALKESLGLSHEIRFPFVFLRALTNDFLYRMVDRAGDPLAVFSQKPLERFLRSSGLYKVLPTYQTGGNA